MRTLFWKNNSFALLLMAAVLGMTWFCYAPGLSGSFLFDDFANLPALGAEGPIKNSDSFWRYITSGKADPTGRPVALASFLIDARDWPAAARPFKITNLLIHLLNGLLLAGLLRRLGLALLDPQDTPHDANGRIHLAAILGAALWLLHPLFVSTTLYVVQREAMLPATFTVIGLILWLKGRDAFRVGQPLKGYAWLFIGTGTCTCLATLSKANGALLPALALVMEYIFLRHAPGSTAKSTWPEAARKHWRLAVCLVALLPSALIAGYLINEGWRGLEHGISDVRPWTLAQRLLTEPRVLLEYLRLIWLPHPFTAGLFNDQFEISHTLWTPWTTLPAILALAFLLIAGWKLRTCKPAIALAILFYFVGQSMESSTIALELYFEHRNYLPTLLMSWPVALWLCQVPSQRHHPAYMPQIGAPVRIVVGLSIVLGLAWMTHARADLWGNERSQALLWAKLNPASARAQAYAAQSDMHSGQPESAIARIEPWLKKNPDQVQLALNLLAAHCQLGIVDKQTFEQARTSLESTRDPGALLTSWFGRAIEQIKTPTCPQLSANGVRDLLEAAMANPRLMDSSGRRQDLYHLRGRLALTEGDADEALSSFNRAMDQQVRPGVAFEQAALLGSAGFAKQGLAHLDHYDATRSLEERPDFGMPSLHTWVLRRQHYWDNELVHLRHTLLEDASQQSPPSR